MKLSALKSALPSPFNALLAVLSAVFLILAFPDFDLFFLAWFALVPFLFAVEREKASSTKSFFLGWIWGICFFFGSCWWLTHAPIEYGGIPSPIAYALLFLASSFVGIFPAIFSAVLALFLRRFGAGGILSAPFLWTAIEFLRFWTTGNNWNAAAYSQAFSNSEILKHATFGGIYAVGFSILWSNMIVTLLLNAKKIIDELRVRLPNLFKGGLNQKQQGYFIIFFFFCLPAPLAISFLQTQNHSPSKPFGLSGTSIIAIQPNVPMSGLKYEDKERLLERHVQLAEASLDQIPSKKKKVFLDGISGKQEENLSPEQGRLAEERTDKFIEELTAKTPKLVVFPESPMNFMYAHDREFQKFLREFTAKNNVSVLFNAAEPGYAPNGLFNSAVMINERGEKISQYNKIHLVPFGEYVPLPEPLASVMPTMVGNFEVGSGYDLMPVGDLRAGIMICFESHFPTLSRRFAADGADVLIEMTNDGYLGNTPILRQHLANAVFRAVETNRPVVRVTNTGISAFIDENGKIHDATAAYKEEVRVWTIEKSDAPQTFYVKYGDWFAWTCSLVSLFLSGFAVWRRKIG